MHQATHRVDKRTGEHYCTVLPPCALPSPAKLNSTTAFERFRAIQNLSSGDHGLALLIHIPTSDQSLPDAYPDALISEAGLLGKHLTDKPELQLLHVYGDAGQFSSQQLQQLFTVLRQHLQLPTNNFAWFSIEIQPDTSSWAALGMLRDAGFNRITLHSNASCFQATESLYEAARTLQYNTITMALALPDNSAASDIHTQRLQSIIGLQPDRILLQGAGTAPAHLCESLLHAGYVQASSHCFVLPDDELLENSCHSCVENCRTRHFSVLGLGAGASSQLTGLYYRNDDNLTTYIQALVNKQLPPARGYREIA